MAQNTKKDIRNIIARSFLNKDRDAFRATLLQHARTFYPDRINDFSESSVGGLLLDFAAEVGDHMSFYLDHQFTELDPELAVESQNLQRHLRIAGVPVIGASPAVVSVAWVIEVPSKLVGSQYVPDETTLPVILEGSVVESDEGVLFELSEDLDFGSRDKNGNLKATIVVGQTSTDGSPSTFILMMGGPGNFPHAPDGICRSGSRTTDVFVIPNSFLPFREITLSNTNVTEVVSVIDSDGNEYHEVESLSQDTVFKGILNVGDDNDLVEENLELIPAPYRFVKTASFDTKLTTLRFGSGNAASMNDDIIPDPSQFALPLYGKRTFSRFSLDPGKLLGTQTLGVSPINTTITVTYRYGGGLSHNVAAASIKTVSTLRMQFPGNPTAAVATQVRASVSVKNPDRASGGEDAPTLDDLRDKIPAARNAQSRIVTKADLLARVYTMPANFGRVFRAGIRSNPRNPLATQLYIISRNADGQLIIAPDSLKKNLRIFLNEFRMISDAIDILDSPVVNIGIDFKIATEPTAVKNIVVQKIITNLKRFFKIENFNIDQPIKIDDVRNIIYNSPGVAAVLDLKFRNITGTIGDKVYSDIKFDVASNIRKMMLIGPPGSIFELRFPDNDITWSAT